MKIKELQEIVARGEDSRHQFKEDIRNGDSLAAEIVAFSNCQGGTIFIGVSDEGALKGLSNKDVVRVNQLISNAASQQVRSPVIVQTENIAVDQDRVVIVVHVPEGIEKPYFDHQGVIWLKSGSDKRRIHSKEELRRLFQEVGLLYADEVPTRADINVLDIELFSSFFLDVYKEKLPHSLKKRGQLLENMNLAISGQLNLAGLLLFAEKPQLYRPEFVVKAVTFPGDTIGGTYLDSEDFEGPLSKVFQGALSFIVRNLRKVQKGKGVNTIGELEVPQIVFEELLVNALIHRDYFVSAPIRLFIFSNRIEIISPGSLPDHLTIEKICTGNSIQRNSVLASFAAKGLLPYRGLGSGILRAIQEWPSIRFIDDKEGCLFVSQIMREKEGLVEGVHKDLVQKNVHLSELQVQIRALIEKNPSISYEVIAENLGKDRSTIRRNIQSMKDMGIIKRSGAKRTGSWEICS